ncbi:MAG: hypothetical protein MSB10_00715 [Clostridiales bacterium]|uniref:hypothetical protein n=1 Tax=Flavonifractor porci TaxID=3133422 RepID=UPI0030ACE689|nr:hypothetical protein [Clostridiales bacterium]
MKRRSFFAVFTVLLSVSILAACEPVNEGSATQSNPPYSSLPARQETTASSNTYAVLSNVSLNTITNLSVLADVGSIQVRRGNEYSITGENLVQDWISIETQSGELTIRYQPPTPDDAKKVDTSTHLFTITLPSEHSLEEANFNTGTGALTIEDFSTEKLIVSQGTGNMTLRNISVRCFVAECGTGSFTGDNVVSKRDSELCVGMGEFVLSGDLSGLIVLEGGTGAATLNLVQPRENYIVQGESFVRKILLDGEPLENYGDEWEFDESAAWEKESSESHSKPAQQSNVSGRNTIQIDGGVGSVSIHFAVTY